ncbi:DUF1842 domain-containing protein [Flavobacterium cupreum]|uniref:DUF1842 domain-containing protein n=1 Tax=Flavobacterium cupreum TaxID=2133766 RepID=A0A434A824_9FLAO|nr:DUF1842 domain-containing protein [Flavobacterium cupreum]RUT70541.1 DUF1842 domain-containing protein [Flavobacterium cupreum]
MENLLGDDYLVKGTIGNTSIPGAPVASFALEVLLLKNAVKGTVVITQCINMLESDIVVQVKGKIHETGFGKFTKVVSLQGQYHQSVSPLEKGSFLADFDAHFAIDDVWNGIGGFSCYNYQIENEAVGRSECFKEELV